MNKLNHAVRHNRMIVRKVISSAPHAHEIVCFLFHCIALISLASFMELLRGVEES